MPKLKIQVQLYYYITGLLKTIKNGLQTSL